MERDNNVISLPSRDEFEDTLPTTHPVRPATDGFKPAWTMMYEPLLPAVVAGSRPINDFQSGGFATAFFSKLR